ncbi:endolysin [Yersinia phage fHe-Yen8-01]|nr:endolysin [Yersinia phage fHe-Yen8-01]
MAIKIPVSAQFDASDLKQQIQMVNDQIRILGNTVAMSSKQKFEPINLKSKEDLEAFTRQMQKMLKIQTELAQKMKQTGQGGAGKNPLMADWSKLYRDQNERMTKMRNMLQFLGVDFEDLPKPKPPKPTPPGRTPVASGSPPPPNRNPYGWGAQGMSVLNSGLRASGPVGGVVSGAIGNGMSAGASAGLMGLVGGLAALGVGKLIGAIADKVEKASDAAIGMDKIYRQIGGISSYQNIKKSMYGAANALGSDITEMTGLASGYMRSANLRRGDNLTTGMMVGGGLSRSYGLDLGSGMNFIGGMRGANVSRSDQDSRRLGLIIGETIAKSGAFGKADEVMQAVSQYAIAQARQSLTQPNISGYAGALSSLAGANVPGLDIAGSAQLLSRVNASLSNGGAAGDASQFLTARAGMGAGLNPFQLRVLREGGMFATKSQMFGNDSQYGNTFGSGPGGNQTYYSMIKNQLGKNYGAGSNDYYLAMANHMGIGVNQAMALDQMGEGNVTGAGSRMSRLGMDLGKINPTAMATIGQIESGRGLAGIANGYLTQGGDKALKGKERQDLTDALKGTDPEKLKDVLTQIAGKRGAVETEGSQIRDGIAQLNNNFTKFADNALPALNVMRMAAVKASGGSEADLRESYSSSEKKDRRNRIDAKYRSQWEKVAADDAASWASGNHNSDSPAAIAKRNLTAQILAEKTASDAEVDKIYGAGSTSIETAGMTGYTGESPSANAAEASAGGSAGGRSLGMRQNNLGNLRGTNGRFRHFGSTGAGIQAMASQLMRYQKSKNFANKKRSTLRDLISIYAPSSENRTSDYVDAVAKATGINPDAPIDITNKSTLKTVMNAMLRQETGPEGQRAGAPYLDGSIDSALSDPYSFGGSAPVKTREGAGGASSQQVQVGGEVAVTINHPGGSIQTKAPLKQFNAPNSFAQRG